MTLESTSAIQARTVRPHVHLLSLLLPPCCSLPRPEPCFLPVPQVLRCCSEFIEAHGVVDGIYRLSGVSSNIQRLR